MGLCHWTRGIRATPDPSFVVPHTTPYQESRGGKLSNYKTRFLVKFFNELETDALLDWMASSHRFQMILYEVFPHLRMIPWLLLFANGENGSLTTTLARRSSGFFLGEISLRIIRTVMNENRSIGGNSRI